MKPPRKRTYHRPKIERPMAEPEMTIELQDQDFPESFSNEISIPVWPEGELPDPVTMYSFGMKQMAILATSCPVWEVRAAAARFICQEFEPVRTVAPDDGKRELISKLRRALEAGVENGEIELEVVKSGTAAEEEAGREEDAQ
jgi:hypothetical protein